MSTLTDTRVLVRLEGACGYPDCSELAFRLHNQLAVPNYSQGASVMVCPDGLQQWRLAHRTARKRADRAERLGYTFAEIDRSRFSDDIFEINTSLGERQGRPMSDGYTRRHDHGKLPDYPCARHAIKTFGVLQGDRLRAYLTLYRVGDLAMISMILGHGDHLRNDVMYLLVAGTIADQAGQGGYFFYNRHDSGTDGLRYFKERLGFRPTEIEWSLA